MKNEEDDEMLLSEGEVDEATLKLKAKGKAKRRLGRGELGGVGRRGRKKA